MTEIKLTDKLIRRISQRCGGWVVDIKQRVSREGFTPEMWGPWVAFGECYGSEAEARHAHENAESNGRASDPTRTPC